MISIHLQSVGGHCSSISSSKAISEIRSQKQQRLDVLQSLFQDIHFAHKCICQIDFAHLYSEFDAHIVQEDRKEEEEEDQDGNDHHLKMEKYLEQDSWEKYDPDHRVRDVLLPLMTNGIMYLLLTQVIFQEYPPTIQVWHFTYRSEICTESTIDLPPYIFFFLFSSISLPEQHSHNRHIPSYSDG